jgi:hypothetical protein
VTNPFAKATRKATYLRLALDSPSGAGKTYTALKIASALAAHDSGRVAVIDTERGSAAKYSDGKPFDFDHVDLESHDPAEFVRLMGQASANNYPVVVVDSGSHEWKGTLGIVDRASVDMRGNTWAGWSKARPAHDAFIDAVTSHRGHVIVTYRAKQETEQYKEDGKTKVRKLGLAPVASDDMDYEFDVWGSIAHDSHTVLISKSRIETIPVGSEWPLGEGLAQAYIDWTEGKEYDAPAPPHQAEPEKPKTYPWVRDLNTQLREHEIGLGAVANALELKTENRADILAEVDAWLKQGEIEELVAFAVNGTSAKPF